MLTLNTKVKKLIITSILTIGLINLKSSHIYSNVTQNNFNSKEKKTYTATQTSKQKDKNEIKETPIANPRTNEQKVKSQENTKEIALKKNSVSNQLSRGGSINTEVDITLTFYTSLAEENGGFNGINCIGKKLTSGTVANNVLPLGTEIYTKEFGTLTVSDRGGNNFNTINRLDVYVPREDGESDRDYFIRVNKMGKIKVKGYIVRH
jgi:3D (Asp-Asp-Asp) domain-containing protein